MRLLMTVNRERKMSFRSIQDASFDDRGLCTHTYLRAFEMPGPPGRDQVVRKHWKGLQPLGRIQNRDS